MSKKYLKNEKGVVRAFTTDNLQLEKPLLNENYDIEVHNRNMDKIDTTIQGLKGKVDNIDITIQDLGNRIDNIGNIVEELELKAEKVTIGNIEGLFEATNVEDALLENKNSILELQEELISNKSALQSNINSIREVL